MPSFRIRAIVLLALAIAAVPAHSIETPRYTVERTLADGIEVRRYDPMLIAETTVSIADYRRAGNEAFRVLANYIFGDNQGRRDIAMTAPVEQRRRGKGSDIAMTAPVEQRRATRGDDIAMTAPVEQRGTESGWVVTFMMPGEWTLDTLPIPNDPRVVIRETPARRTAAIRFSGTWSARSFAEREAELLDTVTRAGLVMVGEPWTARYDPPWTPWFMRRNEILVELEGVAPTPG
jgi:hypothetical protein